MKATFDGTTVMNIEYSAKEIKPHFCKLTGEMEFDCYFDGRYVGTANSHGAAAAKLDELAYEALTEDASACAGFGCVDGCGDCQAEPTVTCDVCGETAPHDAWNVCPGKPIALFAAARARVAGRRTADMDFSPTVNAQLRSQGLRKAHGWEAGWYAICVEFGKPVKVWATDASRSSSGATARRREYREMPVLKRATRHIQAKGIDLQVIRGCHGPYLYDPKFRKQTGKVYGSVELAINAAIAGERPVNTEDPAPPACPWCEQTHPLGKCPTAAALTGMPLIAGLRAELAAARAEIAELKIRLVANDSWMNASCDLIDRYATRFGALS